MQNTTSPSAPIALVATAQDSSKAYVVLSSIGLAAVTAAAVTGHQVNTFMWVRAILLPVVAVIVHRMTVQAVAGSRRPLDRLRTLATVMPVAIIGVDLVPGVCPLWYAGLQTVCMAPVIHLALLTRRTPPGTAFSPAE